MMFRSIDANPEKNLFDLLALAARESKPVRPKSENSPTPTLDGALKKVLDETDPEALRGVRAASKSVAPRTCTDFSALEPAERPRGGSLEMWRAVTGSNSDDAAELREEARKVITNPAAREDAEQFFEK